MQIQTYLFFDGRAEEAIEFYKKALGAKVEMLMRNKESPDQTMIQPGAENKILHSCLKIGDTPNHGVRRTQHRASRISKVLLCQSPPRPKPKPTSCSTLCSMAARCTMPLTKTFFSPSFGMLADKFGVNWMIMVAK